VRLPKAGVELDMLLKEQGIKKMVSYYLELAKKPGA
jgi:hypothetical protein